MRSRRIKIEGDRYLIFYTFDDEPRLGPAATGDAAAQQPARQNDATAQPSERQSDADSSPVARQSDAGSSSASRSKVSADEQPAAGSNPRAPEGRDV